MIALHRIITLRCGDCPITHHHSQVRRLSYYTTTNGLAFVLIIFSLILISGANVVNVTQSGVGSHIVWVSTLPQICCAHHLLYFPNSSLWCKSWYNPSHSPPSCANHGITPHTHHHHTLISLQASVLSGSGRWLHVHRLCVQCVINVCCTQGLGDGFISFFGTSVYTFEGVAMVPFIEEELY